MAEPDKTQTAATAIDSDEDGLTDAEERRLGTDPGKWDTDGDSITDGSEVHAFGTDPEARRHRRRRARRQDRDLDPHRPGEPRQRRRRDE